MSKAGVPLARICSAFAQAVFHCFTGEVRYSGPLSRVMPLGSPRFVLEGHIDQAILLTGLGKVAEDQFQGSGDSHRGESFPEVEDEGHRPGVRLVWRCRHAGAWGACRGLVLLGDGLRRLAGEVDPHGTGLGEGLLIRAAPGVKLHRQIDDVGGKAQVRNKPGTYADRQRLRGLAVVFEGCGIALTERGEKRCGGRAVWWHLGVGRINHRCSFLW